MVESTCCDSLSSSGAIFSISLFLSAVLTMRRQERRASSFAFMASTMSFWIWSIKGMVSIIKPQDDRGGHREPGGRQVRNRMQGGDAPTPSYKVRVHYGSLAARSP